MMRAVHKLLAPIRRRLSNVVVRAVVTLANDSLKMQNLQLRVLADEVLDNVERFQNYGFTSVPLADAEAIVLCLGGHRDHPVVVAVDDRRYRKQGLAPGESAMYTDEGDYILLKRGRIIEVFAGTKVKVTAPLTEVNGNAIVTGTILSNTSVADPSGTMAEMRSIYNSHTHPGGGAPSPQMT